MTTPRRTIRRRAVVRGRGLFSNTPSAVMIRPGEPGSGINITDAAGRTYPADIRHLSAEPIHPAFAGVAARNTTLVSPDGPPAVATVEHVLSALVGLGITDAIIECSGPEIPIADGSAAPFVDAINDASITALDEPAHTITIEHPIKIESDDGSAWITLEPADHTEYSYHLDFGTGSPIAASAAAWDGTPEDYTAHIAPARTFCLQHEAEAMQAAGLFKSLTPADMLVIGSEGPIDNAYRLDHEPASHKLLDLIGDIALAGRPIVGRITASRSGHALNHRAAAALRDLIDD